MASVDLYFDYLSPFAYFASLELPGICASRNAELRLRPVLFAGLLDHWGQRGPAEIPPKALNTFKLCARYAAERDIPYRMPRFHPFVPLCALRVSLAEVAGNDQPRVVEALFAAGWVRGADLGSEAEIVEALDAAGLDGGALTVLASQPAAKAALRRETETAIGRGVFGVPTMIAGDDELFWGVDQLPYLELYLDGRDPLAKLDLAAIASQGRAAERPGSIARK